MEEKFFYRRNLPHYQPPFATYFVTFRLANSLPKNAVEELRKENELLKRVIMNSKHPDKLKSLYNQQKKYFGKFDELLDNTSAGPTWLKNARVAKIVSKAIKFRDEREYELHAYCIMPNHVRMLFL